MKRTPEVVVAFGLPFAGHSELAEQLSYNGWHREALGDHMRVLSQNKHSYYSTLAQDEYNASCPAEGGLGVLAQSFPNSARLADIYTSLILNDCIESMRGRLMKASKVGLRTVIDFEGSTQDERKDVLDGIKGIRACITAVQMDTPNDVCADRINEAIQNGNTNAISFRPEQSDKWRLDDVTDSEGFHKIVRISPEVDALAKLSEAGIDVGPRRTDMLRRLRPSAWTLSRAK